MRFVALAELSTTNSTPFAEFAHCLFRLALRLCPLQSRSGKTSVPRASRYPKYYRANLPNSRSRSVGFDWYQIDFASCVDTTSLIGRTQPLPPRMMRPPVLQPKNVRVLCKWPRKMVARPSNSATLTLAKSGRWPSMA